MERVTAVTRIHVIDVTLRLVTGVTARPSRNGDDAPVSVGRG
jgi:hypothetical protein